MSGPLRAAYTAEQRRQATDWFVIMCAEDDPEPDALQAWLTWMEQHEGHRLAFEDVAQAWHATLGAGVVTLPATAELEADGYEGEQSVAEWLAAKQSVPEVHWRGAVPRDSSNRRVRRWTALVAAGLVVAAVGIISMNQIQRSAGGVADEFVTKAGEQIQITLSDGSSLWLGPKSRVALLFTHEERSIRLLTGEAYFSVKKDKARPFVVRSAGGAITAVGTQFNVRDVDGRILVTVTEGVVTVAADDSQSSKPRRVAQVVSGQQASYTATEAESSLVVASSHVLGERARWRDGILVYRDERLTAVIEDVSRYSQKSVEVQDANLTDLRYSGVVYTSALEEWLAALPESFPVSIVNDGDRTIIRSR